jgi:hypothetical protein
MNVSGYCGVDQKGIESLRQVGEINYSHNEKITDITQFRNLTVISVNK